MTVYSESLFIDSFLSELLIVFFRALQLGVRDQHVVRVVVDGDRELTFGDVLVRVSPNHQLSIHVGTDEANAAHLRTGEPSAASPEFKAKPVPQGRHNNCFKLSS